MQNHTAPRMEWGILFLLFALALALRLIGLDYGYFHGDERVNEAAKVLTGQLVPDQHFYPPLLNYITAVLYGALYVVGRGLGLWADSAAFRAQYFEDPTIFFLAGRVLTGAFGALMAPLFYRVARVLLLRRDEAVLVALFAAFFPISVYLSYIYKGDIPLATATVLAVLFLIRKWQSPELKRMDFGLGLALTLALSFKHSFVFLMVPLFFGYLAIFLPVIGFAGVSASIGRLLLTILVLWPVCNIGIVMDFENFLNFQRIQAVMSITEGATLLDSLTLLWQRALHWQSGLGLLMPFAFLAFPLVAWRGRNLPVMMMIWGALLAGMVLVAFLVKMRQPEHLWISFFAVAQLLGALALVYLTRLLRPIGVIASFAALGMALVGLVGIWQQTLAQPVSEDIADIIRKDFPDRRIMSTVSLPLQQSRAAQDYEFERINKVAAKYDVEMPPLAEERLIPTDLDNAYFVVPAPVIMFGLENATDDDLEGKVRPYAWPPQIDDWTVDLWLKDDVDLFVVSNLYYLQVQTPSLMLRDFYRELEARCDVAAKIEPRKPLYLEREITILDCAGAKQVISPAMQVMGTVSQSG